MHQRRRGWSVAAVLGAGTLALSGCSLGQLGVHAGADHLVSGAVIRLTPAPAGKPVAPSTPLVLTVAAGRLTDVAVTGPSGPVQGSLSVDGHTWTVEPGVLDYDAEYSVAATAVDRTGLATALHQTLRTVAPTKFLGMVVSPRDGAIVGVGLPIRATLDHKLTTRTARAAFERATRVRADGTPVVGGWRWMTDAVAVFRPATYWPGHSTITLTAALKGVKLGTGLWGESTRTWSFRTAAAMVSYVDMRTHLLTVTQDGRTVRVIPVTTGKPGFETRSGIKVIMDKEPSRIMDAATGGTLKTDPEYYRLEVRYAMRLTYSGEFLHSAPWSVAHQGHSNVSHGCTGMSPANALWLYNASHIGDVVVYSGNSRAMEPGNGITVWNVSWERWQRYSALA